MISIITILVIAAGIGYIRYHRSQHEGVGEGYSISSNGHIDRENIKGFITLSLKKERLKDGSILYRGQATWNKASGAPGMPAKVPIQLLKVNRATKTLEILQTCVTGDDGRFFFIVPSGIKVMLVVRTERAVNTPPKVKAFLQMWKKRKKGAPKVKI